MWDRSEGVWIGAGLLLLVAAPLAGQEIVFNTDFEWGDTADWSRAEPLRCDRVESFDRGSTPTEEIHVATWGDDSIGDGSQGSPFATIERAVQDAIPGSAVRVHAGTYGGGVYLSDVAGTAESPIWIGGAPGEARPKLVGGTEGMHLTHAEFVVIHDLEVEGASANGINCDDGGDYDDPLATHHVTFRGLSIRDIGGGGNQDCLKLSGLDDYWVLFSEFANCGGGFSGSGIDHVGCHHGLIARNRFHDLSGNAVQSKGGSQDIEIRWNRFYESGARSLNLGGSTGFDYFRPPLSTTSPNAEARNIRLVSNVIEGSDAAAAYVGCVGCVVVNNTIVDPHNWILRILQETTSGGSYEFEACREGVFTNNLVYFERGDLSTYVNIGTNTEPGTFTFANNLWYAWDNPAQSEPSLPVAESGGIYGLDPELGPDLSITQSSPASGTGRSTSWTWGDIEGACYTSPPSIGAFEPK
ncbi:MAG: hypothetical protein WBO74_07350 [Thermoanaerobaculia bacterium]